MLLRSIVVGCLLALAGPATAGLPPRPISQDLFSVAKHGKFTLVALDEPAVPAVAPSRPAQKLFMAAQDRTDHPLGFADPDQGDKNYGTYYLHYVWPDQGYTRPAHRAVLTELGRPRDSFERATLADFVEVSQRRFETELVRLLAQRYHVLGDVPTLELSESDVGMVIYAISIRVHTVQDIKHRMQRSGAELDISSSGHMLRFPTQLTTDFAPPRWRRDRAVLDTAQFFSALHKVVGDRVSPEAARLLVAAIHNYAPPSSVAARDLIPAIDTTGGPTPPGRSTPSFSMDWMFPAWEWYGRDRQTACSTYDPHLDHKLCRASIL